MERDSEVGFTCGSFDLLHPGHVMMLRDCKRMCDHLIVGLQVDPTTDRKDKNKPVQSVHQRWMLLRGCKYVDEIVIYHTEDELWKLLNLLEDEIDVRFVGEDWEDKDFTGKELDIDVEYTRRKHTMSSHQLRLDVIREGKNLKTEEDRL